MPSLKEMLRRLWRAGSQSRSAKSVEAFGWLILIEGAALLMFPHWVADVLTLPALTPQGASYLRLAGLLVGGLGMLYVASGRLDSEGFVFASLLETVRDSGETDFLTALAAIDTLLHRCIGVMRHGTS